MYEVLFGPIRCVYLDIEWMGDPDAEVPRAVARTAQAALRRVRGAPARRTLILEACGGGKASYHVQLFVDAAFASPADVGDFVRAHVAPSHTSVVDTSPYGTTQCWRCLGCVKRSAPDRPLLPLDGAPVTAELVAGSRVRAHLSGSVPAAPAAAADCPPQLVRFVCEQLNGRVVERMVHRRGDCWVFPSLSRACPISKRTHRSNHVYAVVSASELTWEIRCHAASCDKRTAEPRLLPRSVRSEIRPSHASDAAPAWLLESGLEYWGTKVG